MGFWSLDASFMYKNGSYKPRSSPSSFHFSLVAMGTARTALWFSSPCQSTRVVHPANVSCFLPRFIHQADVKHTLMIDRGDPHWISTIRSAYFGYFGWDRLECKCQVGSSRRMNRKCLLSPEFVNVLVQCCIDFGSSAAIVMTVEMLAG